MSLKDFKGKTYRTRSYSTEVESWFWYLKSVASWPCDAFCAFYTKWCTGKIWGKPTLFVAFQKSAYYALSITCFHCIHFWSGFETEWSSWLLCLQTGKFLLVPRIYLYLLAFVKWKLRYLRLGSLFQSTPSNVLPAITSWRRMTCGCLELPQTQAAPKVSQWWLPLTSSCVWEMFPFFLILKSPCSASPPPFNDTKKTQSRSNDISRKAVAGTPSSTGCGLLTPFFQNPSVHTYLLMVPGSKIVGLMIPFQVVAFEICLIRTPTLSADRNGWWFQLVIRRTSWVWLHWDFRRENICRLQILQCISIYFHQYVSPFLPQFLNCWWQSFWWPQTAL